MHRVFGASIWVGYQGENLVGLFSQREGLGAVRQSIQLNDVDIPTRNRLWNILLSEFLDDNVVYVHELTPGDKRFIDNLWSNYLKLRFDDRSEIWDEVRRKIRAYFFDEWFRVFDILEFTVAYFEWESGNTQRYFILKCNNILEEECSGYRFVGNEIVSITSDEEIAEIEEVLKSENSMLRPVRQHLQAALEHYADRQNPDYRNSIKESVLAVEAIACIISGEGKTTLPKALKKIDKSTAIHPALMGAFNKLYGYTSDAEGIRHALLDEPNLGAEDAKFFLVSCSAFVNYLVSKMSKTGTPL